MAREGGGGGGEAVREVSGDRDYARQKTNLSFKCYILRLKILPMNIITEKLPLQTLNFKYK